MKLRHYPTSGARLPFEDFDRFFAETFGALDPRSARLQEGALKVASPRTDVWEGPDAYALKVELPGVAREHLQVRVKQGALTVSAEVKKPAETEKEAAMTTRRYERTVRLPAHIEANHIEAKLADGLLTVTLPKTAAATPRAVEIN